MTRVRLCDTRVAPEARLARALPKEMVDGPPAKRSRVEESAATADDEPEPARHTRDPQNFQDGVSAIKLRFVVEDGDAEAVVDHPIEYAHQIYPPDGSIASAKPIAIQVLYAASTLDLFFRLADGAPLEGAAETAMFALADAMPPACASLAAFEARAKAPFDPLPIAGDVLSTYTTARADGKTFEIRGAPLGPNAPAARLEFVSRLQSLFLFSIETSEAIDVEDERWSILTVYERPPPAASGGTATAPPPRLVAAATCFRFSRWLAGRGPLALLRVCQVSTLPPYRGHGHGGHLLRATYEYARGLGAAEVTVEDPNDAFRALRDLTDVRLCVAGGHMAPASTHCEPSTEQYVSASKALLITDEQLVRCHEVQQLRMVRKQLAAADDAAAKEAVLKPFRLHVKKRLNKKHKEELDALLSVVAEAEARAAAAEDGGSGSKEEGGGGGGRRRGGGGGSGEDGDAAAELAPVPSKEELVAVRKARLDELYNEQLAEYEEILKRLG